MKDNILSFIESLSSMTIHKYQITFKGLIKFRVSFYVIYNDLMYFTISLTSVSLYLSVLWPCILQVLVIKYIL